MLKLIGNDALRFYAWDIGPGSYLVGRKTERSECDFLITDMTVSRRHARLEVTSDGAHLYVTDLESHNGTMINDRRVTEKTIVSAGDHVRFGNAEFKVIDDSVPSEKPSQPSKAELTDSGAERSVLLSLDEIRKPLPPRVTDLPDLLPTLFDMAKMLVLPEPKEIMLERSLAMVTKIIPADRLAVFFTSEDQQEIYTGALLLPKAKESGAFTLSRAIIKEVLTNKNAILIDNPRQDPRFADQQSIVQSNMRSAMAAPLLDENRVLGILYADTTSPMIQYNEDYLRLFATIGNIISSRLTNYVLLQERHEKEVYEAELSRASMIQNALLPRVVPQVPNYSIEAFQKQCRAVGGDLYDLAVLPDGRILFLIADVSGKGLGAALLMSNILASFRILYNDERFDLTRAVTQVSTELYKYSNPETFATLFIGVLDPCTHRLSFVNAGHNPPLVVRGEGSLEHLEASGIMIGAFDFAGWSEETIALAPGDLLVAFTDGVTEAEKGEDNYSDERLEQLVVAWRDRAPCEMAAAIVKDVETFVEGSPRSDDITMLIVKRDS